MNALFNDLNFYEKTLMEALCSNSEIVSLLTGVENPIVPNKSLVYTQVYPFAYIPYTNQEAKTFITFSIDVPRIDNSLIKDLYVTFEVITHESLMRTKKGKITTLIAAEIEKLFNGSRVLGITRMDLVNSNIDIPVRGYHTRRLTYQVKDWNRVNRSYG